MSLFHEWHFGGVVEVELCSEIHIVRVHWRFGGTEVCEGMLASLVAVEALRALLLLNKKILRLVNLVLNVG